MNLFERTGFVLPKTTGNSMRPLLWSGQHCVIVVPMEGVPRKGDILMFRHGGSGEKETNIVHRLVEIRNDADGERVYITRGDNCLGTETARRENIIGRVAEVHRTSGFRPWHAVPFRQFSTDALPHRIFTLVWTALWPIRRIYYIIRDRYENGKIRYCR